MRKAVEDGKDRGKLCPVISLRCCISLAEAGRPYLNQFELIFYFL